MSVIWTDKARRVTDRASLVAWCCLVLGPLVVVLIMAVLMWMGR